MERLKNSETTYSSYVSAMDISRTSVDSTKVAVEMEKVLPEDVVEDVDSEDVVGDIIKAEVSS